MIKYRSDLPILGNFVRVHVTRPLGMLHASGMRYGLNFGKVHTEPADCVLSGAFIMGMRQPVRRFEGRVIALLKETTGAVYAVVAPENQRYILGQIRRALQFFLGRKEESEWELQCLYEHSCGAIVFHRSQDSEEFSLQRSPESPSQPSPQSSYETLRFLLIKNRRSANWGFPKGHVENCETFEETAKREILEETGLSVRIFPNFSYRAEYVLPVGVEKSVTLFLAESENCRTIIQESEVEDYVWLNFDKTLQMTKFENDFNALIKARIYLRRIGIFPKTGGFSEKKRKKIAKKS